ncbi:MAG: DUF805 domain-containing protein [Acetobacteraceae bacterium]
MDAQWFYGDGSDSRGPFSVEQMQALYQTGTITADTLVWRTGMMDWTPLRQSDLAGALSAGSVPPVLPGRPYGNTATGAAPGSGAGVGFGEAISRGFSQYAVFSGRAVRSEFWFFQLAIVLMGLVAGALDVILFGRGSEISPINTIFSLAVLLPGLGVGVRRLHDTDRSGWWWLIAFVPIAGIITLIVFWCLPGTNGRNRYG